MKRNIVKIAAGLMTAAGITLTLAQQQTPTPATSSTPTADILDKKNIAVQFRLSESGGTIDIETKDSRDVANRDVIRRYGKALLDQLRRGEFELLFRTVPANPLFVERATKSGGVGFSVAPLPTGIQLEMSSSNEGARNAIHDFIRTARGNIPLTPEERSMIHPGNTLGRDAQPVDPNK